VGLRRGHERKRILVAGVFISRAGMNSDTFHKCKTKVAHGSLERDRESLLVHSLPSLHYINSRYSLALS